MQWHVEIPCTNTDDLVSRDVYIRHVHLSTILRSRGICFFYPQRTFIALKICFDLLLPFSLKTKVCSFSSLQIDF